MSGLFVKKITNFQNSGMKCRRRRWKLYIPVLPGGRYEVGIFLPEDMREKGYLDAPIQFFRLKKDENATGVVFDLIMPSEDNYIEGVVVDENENPLEGPTYMRGITMA